MMSANPAYHMHASQTSAALAGQGQVKSLYRNWAETHQCIFYAENEEVAAAALFLASEDAAYISGTLLFVDGGQLA